MNQQSAQFRRREPKVVNFLPNSSYIETAGHFRNVLKDQDQGSTIAPIVWYGTLNAGLRVRDKSPNFIFVEGTLAGTIVRESTRNETRVDEELTESVSQLEKMVRLGEIGKARKLLESIPRDMRAVPAFTALVRAVQLPRVEVSQTGSGHRISRQWLRENSQEYKGRWVALYANELLGDDDSCIRLREKIRSERKSLTGVLFLLVD